MVLFWKSGNKANRMFKSSTWDMVATEKEKHVVSRPIVIADMDCSLSENIDFCTQWIAFNTSEFPYIALSYYNEPFKKYNESMSYPALTEFLYEYFERNCVLNEKWCTEEERERLDEWDHMTLERLMKEHMAMKSETEAIVKQFKSDSADMKKEFKRMHEEVTALVEQRDHISDLLHTAIQAHGEEAIKEVAISY